MRDHSDDVFLGNQFLVQRSAQAKALVISYRTFGFVLFSLFLVLAVQVPLLAHFHPQSAAGNKGVSPRCAGD
jgi:uncharacterized membrane protein (DUF485 family)